MIQFDWERVKRNSGGTNKGIILAMSAIAWPEKMPTKRHLIINPHYRKDYDGISFLINPTPLLLRKYELPNKTLVEYIMLASRRCLADYMLTKNTALDIRLAPYVPQDNQLLTITNHEVQFKYE